MKASFSIVTWKDTLYGRRDYETFMKTIGFETKLCKPRHPFTKGKVERLVRFVKENFLADRVFYNITDLNWHALEWCNSQNGTYHRAVDGVPQQPTWRHAANNFGRFQNWTRCAFISVRNEKSLLTGS